MPRGLYNWTFREIVNFLKDHDFSHTHTEGSHFYYSKITSVGHFLVQVPFHGKKSIKPRTLKAIVRQSGISIKEWLK